MQEGKLTGEVIQSIMEEEKPNQREKPAFRDERITKLIPKSVPKGQEADFVVKALEFYNRHLQRNNAVFGTCLATGEKSRWERYDVLGEIKPECMPDWAKEALAKIKEQQKEKKQKNREER